MTSRVLHIAIDGPVGAGKSDISSALAKNFGITYVYTGAMYRAVAYTCIRDNIDPHDEEKVLALLSHSSIILEPPNGKSTYPVKVVLNGSDVTDVLFTPTVDSATPIVSSIPGVRHAMVRLQKAQAEGKSVVMEGRDIGLRVLPDAQLKVYLVATVEERARRRHIQMRSKGVNKSYQEVLEDTKLRDRQDMTRSTDPLQKLPDAWELDTTRMTQEEVVARIKEELIKRKLL